MKKSDKSEQEKIAQEVLEAFKGFQDLKNEAAASLAGRDGFEEMGNEILNDFNDFVKAADYVPKHIHSGAAIASIVATTHRMAQANPQLENHKTYIVSFPARIVTEIRVNKGVAICLDRGFVEKRK